MSSSLSASTFNAITAGVNIVPQIDPRVSFNFEHPKLGGQSSLYITYIHTPNLWVHPRKNLMGQKHTFQGSSLTYIMTISLG